MRRGAFTAAVVAVLIAVVPGGTRAKDADHEATATGEGRVNVEVRVIRASNAENGLDPSLQDLRDRFSRFSWKSYKLVDTRDITLGPDREGSVPLPNGDVFRMRDVTLDGGRARMTVGTSGVVLKVSLADDGTVIVGGLKEGGGDSELIVAVTADF